MLKSRIIPCLDVHDGRIVKGVQFVDLIDAGDPAEQARIYDEQGADELCFLDITASSDDRDTIIDVVRRTAEVCFMPLTVGGGVRTVEDVRALLLAGADKVSINTAAVKRPEFVAEAARRFGTQCITVAVDAKQTGPGRFRGLHPWRAQRNRPRRHRLGEADGGVGRGRDPADLDGSGRHPPRGFDIELVRAVADGVPVPVIASGGVGSLDHLADGIAKGHASAVLAASIFHFGEHTIAEAKAHMEARGIAVRL